MLIYRSQDIIHITVSFFIRWWLPRSIRDEAGPNKNPQTARECFQQLDVVESAIGTADGSSLLPAPIKVVEVPIPTASVSPETADEYGSSTSRSSLSEAVRSQSCDSNISSVDVLWAGDFYMTITTSSRNGS